MRADLPRRVCVVGFVLVAGEKLQDSAVTTHNYSNHQSFAQVIAASLPPILEIRCRIGVLGNRIRSAESGSIPSVIGDGLLFLEMGMAISTDTKRSWSCWPDAIPGSTVSSPWFVYLSWHNSFWRPRGDSIIGIHIVHSETLSSRRRRVCHRWWARISSTSRASMPSDQFFSVTNFSLVLHDDTTATAERLQAVRSKTSFDRVKLSDTGSLKRCKDP